jgi:TetR/AcrR family transcriptional repressor of nem operon
VLCSLIGNEVLERALAAFWTRGCEATSIDDLVEATDINRGSPYRTFGDKTAAVPQRTRPLLGHGRKRHDGGIVRSGSAPRHPTNVRCSFGERAIQISARLSYYEHSLECPTCGDEIARKIAERLGQQETAIDRVLRNAQVERALKPDQDARALARFFLGVAWGINAVSRTVADPKVPRDMVRAAMSVWDAAGAVQFNGLRMNERRRGKEAQRITRKEAAVGRDVPDSSK